MGEPNALNASARCLIHASWDPSTTLLHGEGIFQLSNGMRP